MWPTPKEVPAHSNPPGPSAGRNLPQRHSRESGHGRRYGAQSGDEFRDDQRPSAKPLEPIARGTDAGIRFERNAAQQPQNRVAPPPAERYQTAIGKDTGSAESDRASHGEDSRSSRSELPWRARSALTEAGAPSCSASTHANSTKVAMAEQKIDRYGARVRPGVTSSMSMVMCTSSLIATPPASSIEL